MKWDRKKKVKCKEVPLVWIFSQEVAGYFFHECIGHILEEDIFRRTNYNVGDMFFGNRLNIYENWEKEISFDDFGKRTKERICLVKNGKIENILSGYNPMQDSSTGNAFTEEVYFPPRVRMNSMFVEAENMTGKIYENVKVAMYVEEVSGGECEPFSGEVGLCVKKAHIVINDKKVVALEPFSLLLNLRDLKKAEIKVGDNKKTMHSLCFKYGAIKKIKYTTPEILIDWRKSSEYITNRDF